MDPRKIHRLHTILNNGADHLHVGRQQTAHNLTFYRGSFPNRIKRRPLANYTFETVDHGG